MAFAGFSEYTFMNWSRIREPYVRKQEGTDGIRAVPRRRPRAAGAVHLCARDELLNRA